MSDLLHKFKKLRRPKLLIQAARCGVGFYRRERDLRRLLRSGRLPAERTAMIRLMDLENEADAERRASDTTYSITRHIELLTALIAESSSCGRLRVV